MTQDADDGARTALDLIDAGYSVIPAFRHGDQKGPRLKSWKQYQERPASRAEAEAWGGDTHAVVCGAVSGHLEVIDFDAWSIGGEEACQRWCEAVEAMAPGLVARLVVQVTPSGGRHFLYRCPDGVEGNSKLARKLFDCPEPGPVVIGAKEYHARKTAAGCVAEVTLIETRGEGGLILVAPSPGYRVVQGDFARPPSLTAAERVLLRRAAMALDESPKEPRGRQTASSPRYRPGDDFNARGDVRGLLLEAGWTRQTEGANEHWCRPGKARGTSATLLEGKVFYCFTSNAPPFEPDTAYAPFAVYAYLRHDGDFGQAAAELGRSGYGDPAAVQAEEEPVDPQPVSVTALVASHPRLRPIVVDGLLREGETMNVIAAPKTGKSWLTIDLALAVARGGRWLGRFQCQAGDVLVIDNELHPETSAHRIPKVAESRGLSPSEYGDRVFVDNLRGRLLDLFALTPYFDAIEPGRFKVVILDAFYRFMPAGGDENDNGTMANIYNRIDAFANRLGCCFVLIHHSTKGSQSGKSVTDVGAGAGAQSRATDTHLVLRPHDEDEMVVLDAAVRSFPPLEPVSLAWRFPVWDIDDAPPRLKGEKTAANRRNMTPAEFARTYIPADRQATRQAILEAAMAGGFSKTAAEEWLRKITAEESDFLRDGLVAVETAANRKYLIQRAPDDRW